MTGMAGMAEWQKEWQNGEMVEMDTYVLFMVHADTVDDTDNDDTLIFYIKDKPIRPTARKSVQCCLFYHLSYYYMQYRTIFVFNYLSLCEL